MPALVLPLRRGAQLDLFFTPPPAPASPRERPLHTRPGLTLLPTPSGVRRWQHIAPRADATPAQIGTAIRQLLQHPDAHPQDLYDALAATLDEENAPLRGELWRRIHAATGGAERKKKDRAGKLPRPPAPATPDFRAEIEEEKKKAARRPDRPFHFAAFAEQGAPAPGERGYVEEEHLPPDALDGRTPSEVASSALGRVRNLVEDPDFLWGLKHLEDRALFGYDEGIDLSDLEDDWPGGWPPHPVVESWADIVFWIKEAIGLPDAGPDGAPWDPVEREAIQVEAWKLGLETLDWDLARHNFSGLERSDLIPARFGDPQDREEIPEWLADAVLADRLDPRQKLRIVNVSKKEAADFIARHHSALPEANARGMMYAIGLQRGDRLVAVATAGTPTGAHKDRDPHSVIELTRIASDGTTLGASSKLAARILDLLPRSNRAEPGKPALFVTYSLLSEAGTTYAALRDKGLRPVAITRGKDSGTGSRKGADVRASKADTDKIVWEAGPGARAARWDLLDPAS